MEVEFVKKLLGEQSLQFVLYETMQNANEQED